MACGVKKRQLSRGDREISEMIALFITLVRAGGLGSFRYSGLIDPIAHMGKAFSDTSKQLLTEPDDSLWLRLTRLKAEKKELTRIHARREAMIRYA